MYHQKNEIMKVITKSKMKVFSALLLSVGIGTSFLSGQESGSMQKIIVDGIEFLDLNKNGKLDKYEDTRLPESKRIDDLMSRLTLNEKIDLVMGTGMKGFEGLIKDMVVGGTEYLVPGAAGTTFPLEKYGIPAVVMTDGPAGVRISPTRKNTNKTFYATGFPVGIALASTWNSPLVQSVGEAMGNEVLEYGSDIQLAPAINIMRNPLCGRNYEYYSEDPLISGKIAASMINGIQKNGSGVSLKHYAANNSEKNRMELNVHVSQRSLREIYLRGFEIAVKESNPATIMSSYNKINGVYTSADYDLLTTILRNEWGFKGLVMTDWLGGYSKGLEALKGNASEHYTSQQLKAGNDLLMPGIALQKQDILNDLKSGTLKEKDLNVCVKRILEMVFASQKMKNYQFSNNPDLKAHASIARLAATEAMVLLENKQQALPITSSSNKLAVFGSYSYNFVAGGTGSGDVNKAYVVSLTDGLLNAGFKIDSDLSAIYKSFVNQEVLKIKEKLKADPMNLVPLIPQPQVDIATIRKSALQNDLAILTIGRSSGEMDDRKIQDDFYLTKDEIGLIDNVSREFHSLNKKVIVVINVGGPVDIASWSNKVDGILQAWLPGQEGGNAVADVLTGKVSPSGKLTITFPIKYEDVSTARNFQGFPADNPTDVVYEEGVYVGYRYFNTFNVKPAYEFGYGLSYTQFEYSNLKINNSDFTKEVSVSIDIKNIGKTSGKEAAQLYLSAPAGKIDKPVKELKAFAKTKLLLPGETQTLTMVINPKDLASFYTDKSSWIADKGTYKIEVGASALDSRQTTTFNLEKDIVVEKVNNVMNPKEKITELKPR